MIGGADTGIAAAGAGAAGTVAGWETTPAVPFRTSGRVTSAQPTATICAAASPPAATSPW